MKSIGEAEVLIESTIVGKVRVRHLSALDALRPCLQWVGPHREVRALPYPSESQIQRRLWAGDQAAALTECRKAPRSGFLIGTISPPWRASSWTQSTKGRRTDGRRRVSSVARGVGSR